MATKNRLPRPVWIALTLLLSIVLTGGTAAQTAAPAAKPTLPPVALWPAEVTPPSQTDDKRPTLDLYLVPGEAVRPAVLIFPGGGYRTLAASDSGPVAQRFNTAGFHAFVVNYRLLPNRQPAQLADAQRAIRLVRSHAAEWRVDPQHIAVCGFSAGGHVAALAAVHAEWVLPGTPEDAVSAISARPDAVILCYPVISGEPPLFKGYWDALIGPDLPPDLTRRLSVETQVTPRTPPVFLFHRADDSNARVEHSLLLAGALARVKVPFELHILPTGGHAKNNRPDNPRTATWFDLIDQWLRHELRWPVPATKK